MDQNTGIISEAWIFHLAYPWPISILISMSQHPFYFTLNSWFSSPTWMHYLFVLDLTDPTCSHSFPVVFHLSNPSDCPTQHQICQLRLFLNPQPSSSNCFTGFFCSSFSVRVLSLLFSLIISRFSCQPLALALFLSWHGFSTLKEFLWPQWILCYKSIHSSLPFLPLLAKQLKYFPDLIKSSHTFDCSCPWLTQLFSSLPYNSLLLSHRSVCAYS